MTINIGCSKNKIKNLDNCYATDKFVIKNALIVASFPINSNCGALLFPIFFN